MSIRRMVHYLGVVFLANAIVGGHATASDLIFMNGFSNGTVTIFTPTDGTSIGGALPTFMGSASLPATLTWTDSVTGFMGTGEEIIPSGLVMGFQMIYLKASFADGESALAESDITFTGGP